MPMSVHACRVSHTSIWAMAIAMDCCSQRGSSRNVFGWNLEMRGVMSSRKPEPSQIAPVKFETAQPIMLNTLQHGSVKNAV